MNYLCIFGKKQLPKGTAPLDSHRDFFFCLGFVYPGRGNSAENPKILNILRFESSAQFV